MFSDAKKHWRCGEVIGHPAMIGYAIRNGEDESGNPKTPNDIKGSSLVVLLTANI